MSSPAITRRLPVLLGFLIAIGPVSTDMYLPAFPAIARDFSAVAAPQISLAAYFIGLSIGQMTVGAVSDRLGRRAPMLAGLVLYTFASLGCALSWSVGSFALFRLLAALGCSAGVVIPRAMVRDLADGHAAAKLFSKLMLVMGVAPILAPMLGAATLAVANWRMIFILAAIYGLLALYLVLRHMPDTLPAERRSRINFVAVLVRYGVIAREPSFITHALTNCFAIGALFAYLAGTPQIFVDHYGWNATEYAALFGFNACAYIGYSQLAPRMVARFGIHPVITAAVTVLAASCVELVAFAWHDAGPLPVMAGLLAAEFGFGLIMPCAMVGSLTRHQAHAGSAAALHGTLQYIGGALASFAVGVLADGTARPMAAIMLLCGCAAMLAAAARPRLSFKPAEI